MPRAKAKTAVKTEPESDTGSTVVERTCQVCGRPATHSLFVNHPELDEPAQLDLCQRDFTKLAVEPYMVTAHELAGKPAEFPTVEPISRVAREKPLVASGEEPKQDGARNYPDPNSEEQAAAEARLRGLPWPPPRFVPPTEALAVDEDAVASLEHPES